MIKVEIIDKLGGLWKTNNTGCQAMMDFTKKLKANLENAIPDGKSIEIELYGQPYSFSDIHYELFNETERFLIKFVLYPAGFKLRYYSIRENYMVECFQEIIKKTIDILYPNPNIQT